MCRLYGVPITSDHLASKLPNIEGTLKLTFEGAMTLKTDDGLKNALIFCRDARENEALNLKDALDILHKHPEHIVRVRLKGYADVNDGVICDLTKFETNGRTYSLKLITG